MSASASPEDEQKIDITTQQAMEIINEAAKDIDSTTLEAMKASLATIDQATDSGFLKMSDRQRKTTYLVCASGKAGAFGGARAGVCLADGRTVLLTGKAGGVPIGAAGSLLLGLVRANEAGDEAVRGQYSGLTVGAAGLRQIPDFFRNLTRLKVGLGIDLLIADGDRGQKLLLVGPSLGVMLDVSHQVFRLYDFLC